MSSNVEEAATRLAVVLEQENTHLVEANYAALITMIPPKEAALGSFQVEAERSTIKFISGWPRPPGRRLWDDDRARGELAVRLLSLAVSNQKLFERSITSQVRIIRIMAQAIRPAPTTRNYLATRYQPKDQLLPMTISTKA